MNQTNYVKWKSLCIFSCLIRLFFITFQKQPAERGSANISMKEIDRIDIDKLADQIEKLQKDNQTSGGHFTAAVDELSEGLKKLKNKGESDPDKDSKS